MSLVHAAVIAEDVLLSISVAFGGAILAAVVPRGQGDEEAGAALPLLRGGDAASSSGAKLSDWIRAYSWFVKSVRSTLSASPGTHGSAKKKGRKKRGTAGD
jgi:hypothetical protein